MAWTNIAKEIVARTNEARRLLSASTDFVQAASMPDVGDPITAIELRTLFAGDLRSADRVMSASFG